MITKIAKYDVVKHMEKGINSLEILDTEAVSFMSDKGERFDISINKMGTISVYKVNAIDDTIIIQAVGANQIIIK